MPHAACCWHFNKIFYYLLFHSLTRNLIVVFAKSFVQLVANLNCITISFIYFNHIILSHIYAHCFVMVYYVTHSMTAGIKIEAVIQSLSQAARL